MIALLVVAPFAFFAAQVEQAKADMHITEPSIVYSTDMVVRDVQGRTAIAWTSPVMFSLPEPIPGFGVWTFGPWLKRASEKELRLTAYHEVCHMLSDGDRILAGKKPTSEESKIIEPKRDRCAALWMEAKRAEEKAAKKAAKREQKKAAKGRFWATVGMIFLMLP